MERRSQREASLPAHAMQISSEDGGQDVEESGLFRPDHYAFTLSQRLQALRPFDTEVTTDTLDLCRLLNVVPSIESKGIDRLGEFLFPVSCRLPKFRRT